MGASPRFGRLRLMYVSTLCVTVEGLEEAVRACFTSALSERVLRYKRDHGLDPLSPRLAVIVQRQLESDAAGVMFSINPINNDYDEVMLNAAKGTGDAVVDEQVIPEHLVLNKVTGARVEGSSNLLNDSDLNRAIALCRMVEAAWGGPVDIEWALKDGILWLLQARPITRWVPLPADLLTKPGERRRLYMDIGLAGGLTINAAISPLGESWMRYFLSSLVSTYLGDVQVDQDSDRLWLLSGGRMYQDLSNILRYTSAKQLGAGQASRDAVIALTLASIDREAYRAHSSPSWMGLGMIGLVFRAYWRVRAVLGNGVIALIFPNHSKRTLDLERVAFHERMSRAEESDKTFTQLFEEHSKPVIEHVVAATMPRLMIGMVCAGLLEKLLPVHLKAQGDAVQRGHQGNVVVEMNAALSKVGDVANRLGYSDLSHLNAAIVDGAPQELSEAWASFCDQFGWRGPSEVDLGAPRYSDRPETALEQALGMVTDSDADSVEAAFERTRTHRQDAWRQIQEGLGFIRRPLARWLYRRVELLLPTRDDPKHDYLRFFMVIRRRLWRDAAALVAAGRLDTPDDIAGLTLDNLEAAARDPDLDLRALRQQNLELNALQGQVVTGFPAVIDSRGRITTPQVEPFADGLKGAGVAVGTVRILHQASDGRRFERGDILVAYVTDPGWTPLFARASAVILEIGGVLQHGAVVAREYGLPCVVGIVGALDLLKDGERVEVDGATGVIRRVE